MKLRKLCFYTAKSKGQGYDGFFIMISRIKILQALFKIKTFVLIQCIASATNLTYFFQIMQF